jgi:FG-GAP-like repeat
VWVDGNVFAHGSRGDAIAQNGEIQRVAGPNGPNGPSAFVEVITRPITVTGNNRFGAKPMAQLGRCDFVGDGKPDAFMATGNTWWARSSAHGQWRFLNVMPEGLSQVVLGDLNGDGRCDVGLAPRNPAAAVRMFSLRGQGPWVPRLVFNRVLPAQPVLAPQR